MNKRLGKVFIDTNIIKHAADFRSSNVFQWICDLYELVYVHQGVYDELILGSLKSIVDQLIKNNDWILFNPYDDHTLTDDEYAIYDSLHQDVISAFERLDTKKESEGRIIKGTKNYGEISSITACLFLGANLICSNDQDIREVINDEHYIIVDEENDSERMIIQDTLSDFCYYCVEQGVASKKEAKRFFKASLAGDNKLSEKLNILNERWRSI